MNWPSQNKSDVLRSLALPVVPVFFRSKVFNQATRKSDSVQYQFGLKRRETQHLVEAVQAVKN